jgi:hypothetical protein
MLARSSRSLTYCSCMRKTPEGAGVTCTRKKCDSGPRSLIANSLRSLDMMGCRRRVECSGYNVIHLKQYIWCPNGCVENVKWWVSSRCMITKRKKKLFEPLKSSAWSLFQTHIVICWVCKHVMGWRHQEIQNAECNRLFRRDYHEGSSWYPIDELAKRTWQCSTQLVLLLAWSQD